MESLQARYGHTLIIHWVLFFGFIGLGALYPGLVHGTTSPSRILLLKSSSLSVYDTPIQGFQETFGPAAYTTLNLEGKIENRASIAASIKELKPHLILALGWKAATVAVEDTPDYPMIFLMVIDWQRLGLKSSNSTGISLDVPVETLFTHFKILAPGIKRIGVIRHRTSSVERVQQAHEVSRRMNLALVDITIDRSDQVSQVVPKSLPNINALWMIPDPIAITVDTYHYLVKTTRAHKIPFLAFSENFTRAGALMSVAPNYYTIGNQAAIVAKRILVDHITPGSIPVSPPIGTSLILNRTVAEELGLTIDYNAVDKTVAEDEE